MSLSAITQTLAPASSEATSAAPRWPRCRHASTVCAGRHEGPAPISRTAYMPPASSPVPASPQAACTRCREAAEPQSRRAAGPQGRRPPPRARAPPTVAWLEACRRWRTPACARRQTPMAPASAPCVCSHCAWPSVAVHAPSMHASSRTTASKLPASATDSGCCTSSRRTGSAGVATGRPLSDRRVGIGGGHVPAAALKRQCETAVAAAQFKQPRSSSACT